MEEKARVGKRGRFLRHGVAVFSRGVKFILIVEVTCEQPFEGLRAMSLPMSWGRGLLTRNKA